MILTKGKKKVDTEFEVICVPSPRHKTDKMEYMMVAMYTLDNLSFEAFKEIVASLDSNQAGINTIKRMRKYVTHLKRAYLEHVLTDIAIKRIKNAVKDHRKHKDTEPYHRAGRRAL